MRPFRILFCLVLSSITVMILLTIKSSGNHDFSYLKSVNTSSFLPVDEIMVRVARIVHCADKPLPPQLQHRGNFLVLYKFVEAAIVVGCHESITYTTVSDFKFLDNLEILAKRWNGPVSVAVYAPGTDFWNSIDTITYLRNCKSSLVKEFVTFHLFFDYDQAPKNYDTVYNYLDEATYNCNKVPAFKKLPQTFRTKKKLFFPINVGRNIARLASPTHFVLASDIELFPSSNFIPKFLAMVAHNPGLFDQLANPPSVFVLPSFEVAKNVTIPSSKTELQKMIKENDAIWFHQRLCSTCHQVPKADEWIEAPETAGLNTFSVTKRLGKFSVWEPFYVGTNNDPVFDEDFTWEGQSNKMPQVFEMCLLDYDFIVLDNAFLVHKPGIKFSKVQNVRFRTAVRRANKLRKIVKKELITRYQSEKRCQL